VSQRGALLGDVSAASPTDQDAVDSNSASSPINDLLASSRTATATGSDMLGDIGSEASSAELSGGTSHALPAGDTLSPGSSSGSEAPIPQLDGELASSWSISSARANMIAIWKRWKDEVISALQNGTEINSPILHAESGVNIWLVLKAELKEFSRRASSGDICIVIEDGTGKNGMAFDGPCARIFHELRPSEKRKGTPSASDWNEVPGECYERQVGWKKNEDEDLV
jgi:hypothetical protein